jgi:hypothetical protein
MPGSERKTIHTNSVCRLDEERFDQKLLVAAL